MSNFDYHIVLGVNSYVKIKLIKSIFVTTISYVFDDEKSIKSGFKAFGSSGVTLFATFATF